MTRMPSGPVLLILISVPRAGMAAPEALLCLVAVLGPPRHLSFSDVRYNSTCVSWEAQRPLRLVKVSYVSSDGSHSGQVRAGTQKFQRLPGGAQNPGQMQHPCRHGESSILSPPHILFLLVYTPACICLTSLYTAFGTASGTVLVVP